MPRWLSLLLLTLALQLPGAAVLPLMDRDEPRFARATVEMMERDTWLVPYFNGDYRFDKPPLTYWWMRLHYLAGGINELTARLHSVLAAWLSALVILSLGHRLLDERTGLLAAVIWLTCLQVLVHGRLCVADMPMILFVTLAMRALAELLGLAPSQAEGKTDARWFGWFYLALGAGFLAKGPIALLAPALALALFRWWRRAPLPWRALRPLSGLLLALLPVAAWGIPALIETRGLFWKIGMGEHVVKRGAEVLNGRAFIPGYYFLTFFLSFYPWSGFLIPVWRHLRAERTPVLLFLAAWLAAPLLIFSCYATQLPHYILPGFPAAALLTAACLERHPSARHGGWLLALALLLPGLALGLGSRLIATADVAALLRGAAVLLVVLGACGLALPALLRARRPLPALGFPALALGFAVVFMTSLLRQQNATLGCLRPLEETSAPASGLPPLSAQTACLGWDYTEPSLVFYSGRTWTFTGKPDKAASFLRRHPDALVVALRREWTLERWLKNAFLSGSPAPSRDQSALIDTLLDAHPRLQTRAVTGFNAARMSRVELVLLRQTP